MDPELQRYRALVTEMFEMDSTEPFSNGQPSHAAIIFAEMLRRAKSQVLIFCKELAEDVFDKERDIIPALKSALERNVDVAIIVQEKPTSEQFLEFAKRYREDRELPGEVSVIGCDDSLKAIRDIPLNFAVMDRKAIRAEFDKGKIEAVACANNPVAAKTLIGNFRKIQKFILANGGGIDILTKSNLAVA